MTEQSDRNVIIKTYSCIFCLCWSRNNYHELITTTHSIQLIELNWKTYSKSLFHKSQSVILYGM